MKLPVNYDQLPFQQRRAVREEYVRVQNGLCAHCRAPLNSVPSVEILKMKIDTGLFPENFFKHPVHLHHSHETGMTIGAVHCECNAVLLQYHGE